MALMEEELSELDPQLLPIHLISQTAPPQSTVCLQTLLPGFLDCAARTARAIPATIETLGKALAELI